MMNIRVRKGYFSTFVVEAENGDTRLIQTDWDLPGLAAALGWLACDCGATDGTVDCPHHTATDMIAAARRFLEEHEGEMAEDPGYF